MSDPRDDADELSQWRELFARLVSGKPLMPWPEACQDVAFVAFMLSKMGQFSKEELVVIEESMSALGALIERMVELDAAIEMPELLAKKAVHVQTVLLKVRESLS